MNYLYDIPGTAERHPDIADHPNISAAVLDAIQVSHAVGTPIDPDAIRDARETIDRLSMVRGNYNSHSLHISANVILNCLENHPDIITDPVIESAKNRVVLLMVTRK